MGEKHNGTPGIPTEVKTDNIYVNVNNNNM